MISVNNHLFDGDLRVKVTYFDDGKSFQNEAMPKLMGDYPTIAKNSLLLNIVNGIISGRYVKEKPLMGIVSDGEGKDLIFLMTPPERPLVISNASQDALSFLANDLAEKGVDLIGVLGPFEEVEHFSKTWNHLTNTKSTTAMDEGVYVLEEVIIPEGIEGELRATTLEDLDLVIDLWRDFAQEAIPDDPMDEEGRRKHARRGIEGGEYYLWEVDGTPVTMIGIANSSPISAKVALVYTPPKFRRKGYGSAATAEISKRKLEEGKKFCSLYTDLSNPTSNSIYQKIGYVRVGTLKHNKFLS